MTTSGIVGKGDLEVCGPVVKSPPANAGDSSSIPGSEDPLEKEMETHSSIIAWEIPWTEGPGRLQSLGSL